MENEWVCSWCGGIFLGNRKVGQYEETQEYWKFHGQRGICSVCAAVPGKREKFAVPVGWFPDWWVKSLKRFLDPKDIDKWLAMQYGLKSYKEPEISKEEKMENKKFTVNPQTGQTHTAKWPSIICVIGAVLAPFLCPFIQHFTGIELDWKPISVILLGAAGLGAFTMARRAS